MTEREHTCERLSSPSPCDGCEDTVANILAEYAAANKIDTTPEALAKLARHYLAEGDGPTWVLRAIAACF